MLSTLTLFVSELAPLHLGVRVQTLTEMLYAEKDRTKLLEQEIVDLNARQGDNNGGLIPFFSSDPLSLWNPHLV